MPSVQSSAPTRKAAANPDLLINLKSLPPSDCRNYDHPVQWLLQPVLPLHDNFAQEDICGQVSIPQVRSLLCILERRSRGVGGEVGVKGRVCTGV